jgi:hypothetical protein
MQARAGSADKQVHLDFAVSLGLVLIVSSLSGEVQDCTVRQVVMCRLLFVVNCLYHS